MQSLVISQNCNPELYVFPPFHRNVNGKVPSFCNKFSTLFVVRYIWILDKTKSPKLLSKMAGNVISDNLNINIFANSAQPSSV